MILISNRGGLLGVAIGAAYFFFISFRSNTFNE
jgi:hypothetical protein